MKIELLCTGDEILSGKTVNSNYSYLARKLQEHGFAVVWGTTVGDDREHLLDAFTRAGKRADAVIVNGGLGPTVDDLSQEVAAQAAGVALELHDHWHRRIADWYQARGREMPPNNTKQAMLPAAAEFIDNPIGTACGFAMTIGSARFFFTPGVPRELFIMMEQQVIPRLRALRGGDFNTRIKRFHSFGIGESRADRLLEGVVEGIEQPAGGPLIKLGFQSHFPQLETKLTAHGGSGDDLAAVMAPVEMAVRQRLGNYIVSEDEQTIEQAIIAALAKQGLTVAVAEMHTGGMLSARLSAAADYPGLFQQGVVASEVAALPGSQPDADIAPEQARRIGQALRRAAAAEVALVVLSAMPPVAAQETYADIVIAVASPTQCTIRRARLPGSAGWSRLGATELGLDCLRRLLQGLPVAEPIDFEQQ